LGEQHTKLKLEFNWKPGTSGFQTRNFRIWGKNRGQNRGGRTAAMAGRIPASSVAGGEGEVGEQLEEVKSYLGVG